jgi:hypothetical protein
MVIKKVNILSEYSSEHKSTQIIFLLCFEPGYHYAAQASHKLMIHLHSLLSAEVTGDATISS